MSVLDRVNGGAIFDERSGEPFRGERDRRGDAGARFEVGGRERRTGSSSRVGRRPWKTESAMMDDAGLPVQVGDVLAGKYRVESVLGAGAMGVVIAVTHLDLGELRAVKLMRPSLSHDAGAVERFMREARATARLKNRHVAKMHDIGRLSGGDPFIVMEHFEGSDLKSLLTERGALPPAEAVRYVREACEAIGEAHAAFSAGVSGDDRDVDRAPVVASVHGRTGEIAAESNPLRGRISYCGDRSGCVGPFCIFFRERRPRPRGREPAIRRERRRR